MRGDARCGIGKRCCIFPKENQGLASESRDPLWKDEATDAIISDMVRLSFFIFAANKGTTR